MPLMAAGRPARDDELPVSSASAPVAHIEHAEARVAELQVGGAAARDLVMDSPDQSSSR
jgi:hypothetical protein